MAAGSLLAHQSPLRRVQVVLFSQRLLPALTERIADSRLGNLDIAHAIYAAAPLDVGVPNGLKRARHAIVVKRGPCREPASHRRYFPSIIGNISRTMVMAAGPTKTTKMPGKMK